MAKRDLLIAEVNKIKPTCIIITETHLNPKIPNNLVEIKNYVLYRHDRIKGTGWGGVAIYVSHTACDIPLQATLHPTFNNNPKVEALWLNLKYGKFELVLAGVYRPTHYTLENTDQLLFNTIKIAAEGKHPLLIMGDFNLPDLKWPLQEVDSDCYNILHGKFIDMYVNTNLNQLVTSITRKRNNEESLLDLILCNEDNLCTSIDYRPNIGKSDHLVLIATIQIQQNFLNNNTKPIQRRNFYKANYDEINTSLLNKNILNLECLDVELAWKKFSKITHEVIDLHVPLSKIHTKRNKNKPWINQHVLDLIEDKICLWNTYLMNRSDESYKSYRTINNKIVSLVRNLRIAFEREVANSGPKSFYSYIRQQLSSTVSIPTSLKDSNNKPTNDVQLQLYLPNNLKNRLY